MLERWRRERGARTSAQLCRCRQLKYPVEPESQHTFEDVRAVDGALHLAGGWCTAFGNYKSLGWECYMRTSRAITAAARMRFMYLRCVKCAEFLLPNDERTVHP